LAFFGSEWLPVAVGGLLSAAALVVWIHSDGMMDREEAHHVLRAIDTYDAAFGSATTPPSLRRLIKTRVDQVKPWYGWPAYLPVAICWKLFGRTYDNGVLANLFFWAAVCGLAGSIGFWFDRRSVPTIVLFHALLPGALIWAHFFNVTLAVVAMTYLAVCTLLFASSWQRRGRIAMSGLVCGVLTVAKSTTVFFWVPLAAVTLWRALSIRSDRPVVFKNVIVFAAGLLPAALHFAVNRAPLLYWARLVHDLYRSEFTLRAFIAGAQHRPYEILLPFHIGLAALGFVVLAARRDTRCLAVGFALWPIPTIVGVFFTGGFPGTTRDDLPLALPAALLASLAASRLPRAPRVTMLWSLCAYGALFLAVNFFGRTVAGAQTFDWLRPPVDGVPNIRLRPSPPLIDATVDGLSKLIPASGQAPCDCLPVTPYPITAGGERPTVLLDHVLIGPENLYAHFALLGKTPPWNVGYVPYPLPPPALRTAISCASAIVLGEGAMSAEFMGAEERAAQRRRLVVEWGQSVDLGRWPGFGTLSARRRTELPLCGLTDQAALDGWVTAKTVNPEEGLYYARYLKLLISGGEPAILRSDLEAARRETNERLRRLEAREDPASTTFGENHLATAVRASLAQMRIADGPEGEAGDAMSGGTVWLRRGTALAVGQSRPILSDRGFALAWGEPLFPRAVSAGASLNGAVQVVNRSPESWPSIREARGPAYAVRLVCRIMAADGTEVSAPQERGEIRAAVAPGAQTAIPYRIQAPKQRGAYRLECDLVQELHSWFSSHGNPKMSMEFVVE